jgi:ATPase subunit of ABC transporter with duplicated ATPase domains
MMVREDVVKLCQTAEGCLDELSKRPETKTITREAGAPKETDSTEELKQYRATLSYLSQSARMPDTPDNIAAQEVRLPENPDTEKTKVEYQKKLLDDSEFLVPECPKLRVLVVGKEEAGKSTLCGRLLGLSDESVSYEPSIFLPLP